MVKRKNNAKMKIVKILSMLAVAASVVCSCSREDAEPAGPSSDAVLSVVFSAGDVSTRVYYDEIVNVCWSAEDRIGVFADRQGVSAADNAVFECSLSEGGRKASFSGEISDMGDGDYAVLAYYPYDETVSGNVADGTLKGCLPATQNMYVRGEGKNDSYDASADWLTATSALSAEGGVAVGEPLVFKRLFAPVRLTVTDTGSLLGEGEKILSVSISVPEPVILAGEFTADLAADAVSFDSPTNKVTVETPSGYEAPADYYFIVNPVEVAELEGREVTIEVVTTAGRYVMTRNGGKFTRGILNTATVNLEPSSIGDVQTVTVAESAEAMSRYTVVDLATSSIYTDREGYGVTGLPDKFATWKAAITGIKTRLGGTMTASQDGKVYIMTRENRSQLMQDNGWIAETPAAGGTAMTENSSGNPVLIIWSKTVNAGESVAIPGSLTDVSFGGFIPIAPNIELPPMPDAERIVVASSTDVPYTVINLSESRKLYTDRDYEIENLPAEYASWQAATCGIQTRLGGTIVSEREGNIYVITRANRESNMTAAGWTPVTPLSDESGTGIHETDSDRSLLVIWTRTVKAGEIVSIPTPGGFGGITPIAPSIEVPDIPTVESVIVDSGGATQYRITDLAGNPLFNENRSDYIVNLPEKYASWKIASTNISFQRLGGTITSSQDGKVFMLTHTKFRNVMIAAGWTPETPVSLDDANIMKLSNGHCVTVWSKVVKASEVVPIPSENVSDTDYAPDNWGVYCPIAPSITLPANE